MLAAGRKDAAEAAFAALPAAGRAKFGGEDGPNAAFEKLYEGLQEMEPSF
jgi:hypothetical protein